MDYKQVKFLFEELGMTFYEISIYLGINKSKVRKIAKRHKLDNKRSKKRKRILERAKIFISFDRLDKYFKRNTGNLADLYIKYGKFENDTIFINCNSMFNSKGLTLLNKWIKKDLHICNKINNFTLEFTEKSSVKFMNLIYPYHFIFTNPVETLKANNIVSKINE